METKELQDILNCMMTEIHEFCEKKNIKYTLAYGTLLGAVRHQGFIPWDDDMDIFMLPADFVKFRSEFANFSDLYFLQNKKCEQNYYLIFDKVRLKGSKSYDKDYENFDIREGIFIDIFPLYYVPHSFFRKYTMLLKLQLLKFINLIVVLNANKYERQIIGELARAITKVMSISQLNRMLNKIQDDLLRYPPSNTVVDIEFKPLKYLETSFFTKIKKAKYEEVEYYVPINSHELLKTFYNDYREIPDEANRECHDNFEMSIEENVKIKLFNLHK